MLDMTLVVVAKNETDLLAFARSAGRIEAATAYDFVPVINTENRGLASIANQKLDRSTCAVFGLAHADMEFGLGSLQAFFDCALTTFRWIASWGGHGAVCGACGRANRFFDSDPDLSGDFSYVWSKDWGHPTARQLAAGYPANPNGPCPVSTLDSSCIFFRRDLGLRFDEKTFDGFHCHGEDLCLQAHSRGIPVLVPAANAWHACPDVNGPDWGAKRDVYARRLRAKWAGVEFVTT